MQKIVNSQMFVNEAKRVITTKIKDASGHEFIGQAYCSADDAFDIEFGSKLSYLRAKRKMLNAYNSDNKKWYKKQMAMFAQWKKDQEAEIDTYDMIINRVNKAIDEMLDNQ